MSQVKELTLNVTGMSCGHCVKRIENAVGEKEGVKDVKVNLSNEEAYINYDAQQLEVVEIIEIIKAAGYEADKKS